MVDEVILDDYKLKVFNFNKDTIPHRVPGKSLHYIIFDFKVRGQDDYHDVTVLLYKETFDVSVPRANLRFKATIDHYSTSIPNFDHENAVVDFKLGLIESTL